MNSLQAIVVYSLAFIGIMALTVVAVIGFALWYHNRVQRRTVQEAKDLLEAIAKLNLAERQNAKVPINKHRTLEGHA